MRIGWRKLFSHLTQKSSAYDSAGIEFSNRGLSIAVFKRKDGELCWVLGQHFPLDGWQAGLKQFVEEHKLANTPTVISFAVNKYQLLQVDKPDVPEEEIAQAVTWTAKELLTTQDEVQMDYFDLPAQTTGANKINVVAIKREELDAVCHAVLDTELSVKNVTVNELANCELMADDGDAVITLIQEPNSEICLNIVKDKQLYFSRRMRGHERLSTFTEMELQMGVVDALSIEIQRSIDYFEGQLRQAPAKRVLLNLDTEHQGLMAELIKKAMLVDAEPLVPAVNKDEELSFSDVSLASLGAALSLLDVEQTSDAEPAEEAEESGS